jgi:phenylacetate-CoA ligase
MIDTLARLHWRWSTARQFPGVHSLTKELRREALLSRSAWRERNIERLRRMLTHAQDSAMYYRALFANCGFDPQHADLPSELSRIPLLTKTEVRGHLDSLLADGVERSRLLENATGGSTGIPLRFYQDERYQVVARAG